MEEIRTEHLSFAYPGKDFSAIHDLSITLRPGSFTVLFGKSGCGKSTLLRLLKPALSPQGSRSGKIYLGKRELSELSEWEQAECIGFVLQNPDNQLVCDKVWHELAFGLESLSYSNEEIRMRVSEMASFFGIEDLFFRDVHTLSGGQKQLLNLAAVMTMQPSILILDEPTSQLDPIAAESFLHILSRINRELGTTILISEHRLEEVFPLADQVLYLENGTLLAAGAPNQIGAALSGCDMFSALPTPMRIFTQAKGEGDCPVTVRQGRNWLSQQKITPLSPRTPAPCDPEVVLSLDEVWFRYEKTSPDILRGCSLKLHRGELYALLGGNGTGKTTALSIAAGLLRPLRGRVQRKSAVTMLSQNPQSLFTRDSLREELSGLADQETQQEVIALCELDALLDMHPYDLSGGEQQRAALAMALLQKPEILILDEPTKGLDACFKKKLADILKTLKNQGISILMVSHDLEFCAEYADRIGLMFCGQISSEGAPEEFFSEKSFYTTAANRMSRGILSHAILPSELLTALGQNVPTDSPKAPPKKACPPPKKAEKQEKAGRKKRFLSSYLPLLLVPLTVLFGIYFLHDRKYYWISLLVLAETMLSFFLHFERRKPSARELVTISVLCATAILGRVAFSSIPQFKPSAAVVILSGLAFGGECGFLVGAMTAFLSNFFFGQGPWTPWQMLSFGLLGFLFGIGYGRKKPKRLALAAWGFLAVFFLYGGIMNLSTVLMSQPYPTPAAILSACALGAPFDLIHAASTALFLWLGAIPILKKFDRVKTKYGFSKD